MQYIWGADAAWEKHTAHSKKDGYWAVHFPKTVVLACRARRKFDFGAPTPRRFPRNSRKFRLLSAGARCFHEKTQEYPAFKRRRKPVPQKKKKFPARLWKSAETRRARRNPHLSSVALNAKKSTKSGIYE